MVPRLDRSRLALAAIVFLSIGAIAVPWAAALLREHRSNVLLEELDVLGRRRANRVGHGEYEWNGQQ